MLSNPPGSSISTSLSSWIGYFECDPKEEQAVEMQDFWI
jgi:hypothetical protein